MSTSAELLQSADLANSDAMTAAEWISGVVKRPEILDVARFSAIVMNTLPGLECAADSAMICAEEILRGPAS